MLNVAQVAEVTRALSALPDWFQAMVAKLPGWAQGAIAGLLGAGGGWGLFVIAFIDSSFGTLPIINDALVIALSLQNPAGMPFYAAMATLGSVLGCLTIFYLAHKGGEVALHKKMTPQQIERIRGWYEKNEFLTVAIPAVMPPPTPFKLFVLAAGVFQVRLRYFIAALTVGRGVRYFMWGFLTIHYGEQTIVFLRSNFLQVSGVVVAVMLAIYLVVRLRDRYRNRRGTAPA
ncbi:MAG: YqaA family protein [Candidatus Acidiferrales bacterium]